MSWLLGRLHTWRFRRHRKRMADHVGDLMLLMWEGEVVARQSDQAGLHEQAERARGAYAEMEAHIAADRIDFKGLIHDLMEAGSRRP